MTLEADLDPIVLPLHMILAGATTNTGGCGGSLLIKGQRRGEFTIAASPRAMVGWWRQYKVVRP
jgi:hypothetical protein